VPSSRFDGARALGAIRRHSSFAPLDFFFGVRKNRVEPVLARSLFHTPVWPGCEARVPYNRNHVGIATTAPRAGPITRSCAAEGRRAPSSSRTGGLRTGWKALICARNPSAQPCHARPWRHPRHEPRFLEPTAPRRCFGENHASIGRCPHDFRRHQARRDPILTRIERPTSSSARAQCVDPHPARQARWLTLYFNQSRFDDGRRGPPPAPLSSDSGSLELDSVAEAGPVGVARRVLPTVRVTVRG